ncbi:MAG TPA: DHH family phosphoesterase, partial [Thermoplasmatales archaeon]|nr:DHH family phosphoesterase [Thermoplasmatales archaeon]
IILDHHQPLKDFKPPDNILEINSNLCNFKGDSEACGATLSYSLATSLNKDNRDLAPLAITGFTGDKQYIGGVKGLNKTILEEAVNSKIVTKEVGIKTPGETIEDILYYTVDPYYPGISGNKEGIKHLLKRLKIDSSKHIDSLTTFEKKKLFSALLLLLIKTGNTTPIILDTIVRERYQSTMTHGEIEYYADLLDACGKGEQRDLAFAVALGDEEAYKEATLFYRSYTQLLLDELQELEVKGAQEKKHYRYFYSKESSRSGVVAGIAVNYLFDDKKPLISLVRHKDELHVSSRGNQRLVDKGLNLGEAMRLVANKLGGQGGGHRIAAGATIPLEKEELFLEELDMVIGRQLEGEKK